MSVALGLGAPADARPRPSTEVVREDIGATIVSILPQGSRDVLVLNRGLTHGVAMGDPIKTALGPCRMVELYALRLKCIIEVSGVAWAGKTAATITIAALAPEAPRELTAAVTHVVPEESGTSLLVDIGYGAGVQLGAEGTTTDGARCLVWSLRQDSAWCLSETPGVLPGPITIQRSGVPGRTLEGRLISAGAMRPRPPPVPPPGARAPAPPMTVVRMRGDALVASHACLGFSPSMDALYFVDTAGKPPPPENAIEDPGAEAGLVVRRVDLALRTEKVLYDLPSGRPVEAAAKIEALRVRESLVACRVAATNYHDVDGDGPRGRVHGSKADHGSGVVFFWQEDDGRVWAAAGMDGKAITHVATATAAAPRGDPGASSRRPELGWIYFAPPSTLHVGRLGDAWQVFDVTPR